MTDLKAALERIVDTACNEFEAVEYASHRKPVVDRAVAAILAALSANSSPAPEGDVEAVLEEFREHVIQHATQWKDGGGSHHHPIWARVADALERRPSTGPTLEEAVGALRAFVTRVGLLSHGQDEDTTRDPDGDTDFDMLDGLIAEARQLIWPVHPAAARIVQQAGDA